MRVLADWLLTLQGLALHLPTRTGVVADLHLGYGLARCRAGEAVPCAGLEEALARIGTVMVSHGVRRMVIAGDLFEDGYSPELAEELVLGLQTLGVELAGVAPGNHDRGLSKAAGVLPLCPEGVELGGWRVLHGDGPLPAGRLVLGHFHPCLRWDRFQKAPCYLVAEDRLLLPAFSLDAAGVNVLGQESWDAFRCCAITGEQVLDLGTVADLRRVLQGKGRGKRARMRKASE